MGTNYYAIPTVDEELKWKMDELLVAEKWEELSNMIPRQVHLGKSSIGWQFIFDHNDWKYFDETEKSLISFIDRCKITDEYGEDITPKKFWELVQTKMGLEISKHDIVYFGHPFSTEFS